MRYFLQYAVVAGLLGFSVTVNAWCEEGGKTIRGSIVVGGQEVAFEVPEDGLVLLRDRAQGPAWYALVPKRGRFDIKLNVLKVEDVKQIFFPRSSFVNSVEPVNSRLQSGPISAMPFSDLRVSVPIHLLSSAENDGLALDGIDNADLCCVSCGKVTVCATSVTMSCGSCGGADVQQ